MNNKNKETIIIILVSIVIFILLVVMYFVFGKKSNAKKPDNTTNDVTTTKNDTSSQTSEYLISDLARENDKSVLKIVNVLSSKKYNEDVYSANGNTLNITCDENKCMIKYNSNDLYNYNLNNKDTTLIYVLNNCVVVAILNEKKEDINLIIQNTAGNKILNTLNDSNKKYKAIGAYYKPVIYYDENSSLYTPIIIQDNKMYYCYETSNNYLNFAILNLEKVSYPVNYYEALEGMWINCDNNLMASFGLMLDNYGIFIGAVNGKGESGIITDIKFDNNIYEITYVKNGDDSSEKYTKKIDASNISKNKISIDNIIYEKDITGELYNKCKIK